MNPKEYVQNAIKTESNNFTAIRERMSSERMIRLDHASDGLVTEAGELKDAIKKYKFYGKDLDLTNISEEVGDMLWYIAIITDELSVDIEYIMEQNIVKLKARYGEKFNVEGALNRDLDNEREILIGGGDFIHYTKNSEYTFCGRKNLLTNNVSTRKKSVNCPKCLEEMI